MPVADEGGSEGKLYRLFAESDLGFCFYDPKQRSGESSAGAAVPDGEYRERSHSGQGADRVYAVSGSSDLQRAGPVLYPGDRSAQSVLWGILAAGPGSSGDQEVPDFDGGEHTERIISRFGIHR